MGARKLCRPAGGADHCLLYLRSTCNIIAQAGAEVAAAAELVNEAVTVKE